jgi:hypothetical protein
MPEGNVPKFSARAVVGAKRVESTSFGKAAVKLAEVPAAFKFEQVIGCADN